MMFEGILLKLVSLFLYAKMTDTRMCWTYSFHTETVIILQIQTMGFYDAHI